MSKRSSGKSPYQRSNAAGRGRSWMLVVTVVILLIATAAWITTYTRAVATTSPDGRAPVIDPGAGTVSGSTSGPSSAAPVHR